MRPYLPADAPRDDPWRRGRRTGDPGAGVEVTGGLQNPRKRAQG